MSNLIGESTTGKAVPRRRALSTVGVGIGVALAGCLSETKSPTPQPEEATVTIRLQNRDSQPREFEIVVNQGESLTDSFTGVLPAEQREPIEMVATFRATDEQHDFTIRSTNGQRGRTWEPTECGDLLVEAFIQNGDPGFETECRSS